MRAFLVVLLAACAKNDRCERLAARLMPNPDAQFVSTCRAQLSDPAFEKTVDCLLAVPHGLMEADIKACPGSDQLPLYFQF